MKGPSTFHGHSSNTPQLQLTELNESSQSAKWRIAEGIWRSGSTTSLPYPTKYNVTQYINVNYFLLRITWQSTTSSLNTCDSTFTCFAMHLWHIGKRTIMNTLPWHVISYVGHMRTPNTARNFKTNMQSCTHITRPVCVGRHNARSLAPNLHECVKNGFTELLKKHQKHRCIGSRKIASGS